ncbi:MAG: helix-hairpin-helix domain-containing protein [Bacteroidota bacterium]|nr:helix-hairpin-helix domain-containing protein [Bacteroidota bacterium]
MRLIKLVNNYFGFNKQQRSGLLILCCISFVLLLARIIYPYFIVPKKIIVKNLPLIENKIDSAFEYSKNKYSKNYNEKINKSQLFVFNPNNVTLPELLKLGFREKTANTFIKFRSKGFKFKQKEDLKKIYGVSDYLYNTLEPYILIDSKSKNITLGGVEGTSKKSSAKKIIELNSCDSLELLDLKGIGPSYAKRILKYRSMLGGFFTIEQLKEVYGFTDELYAEIKPFIKVNPDLVKKININTDDFKTVNKHPYLSYELTKQIFNFKRKTPVTASNFKEVLNDDAVYTKVLGYINFD